MSKEAGQMFILASMLVIVGLKTDIITKLKKVTSLALTGK